MHAQLGITALWLYPPDCWTLNVDLVTRLEGPDGVGSCVCQTSASSESSVLLLTCFAIDYLTNLAPFTLTNCISLASLLQSYCSASVYSVIG